MLTKLGPDRVLAAFIAFLLWLVLYEAIWYSGVASGRFAWTLILGSLVDGTVVGIFWREPRLLLRLAVAGTAGAVIALAAGVDAAFRPNEVEDVLVPFAAVIVAVFSGVPIIIGFVITWIYWFRRAPRN